MVTFLVCALIAALFLCLIYIWGKTFLTALNGEACISDSILFGFIVMHILFQLFYLPFLLTRGSFYVLAVIWIIAATLVSTGMVFYLHKRNELKVSFDFSRRYLILMAVAVLVVGFLCVYIGGRPRNAGPDTIQYIHQMDKMVYRGTIWNEGDELQIHQVLNSFYSLFAVISWITGTKPIFLNHYTMRFLGIILASIMAYRFGRIAFGHKSEIAPVVVAILVPAAMMAWDTPYGLGMFFFARTNVSKAFCQILLFPLAVSVFWEMFRDGCNRKNLWMKEIAVALSAIPVAVSSMSIYPVIVFTGAVALMAYDRFKGWLGTAKYAILCVMPNILYMGMYVLYQRRIFRF